MLLLLLAIASLGLATLIDDPEGIDEPTGGEPEPDEPSEAAPVPEASRILGGFGSDQIDLRGQDAPIRATLFEGNDTLITGNGDATVYGGAGADIIKTGAGDDRVFLGDGRDLWTELSGQPGGDDLVRGGNQNDKLVSISGADTLYGDLGADILRALDGDGSGDSLYGGFGKDRLWMDAGDSGWGGAQEDEFNVVTGAGPVFIGDFSPREDILVIDLPKGMEADHNDLAYFGTDGERITLTIKGMQVAVLDNVWFSDLRGDVIQLH